MIRTFFVLAALVLSCGGAAPSADSPPGGGERASSAAPDVPSWEELGGPPTSWRLIDPDTGIACYHVANREAPQCVRYLPLPLPNLGTEPRVRRGR